MSKTSDRTYDLILIGSGVGALTVASLMARFRGKRVLVIEQHFRAGGYTHDFERGRFKWDTGLHYIGQMYEGSRSRQLFDLITDGRVDWRPIDDPFEVFVYPGCRIEVPSDEARYIEVLCQRFPDEVAAIRRYFKLLRRAETKMSLTLIRHDASRLMRLASAVGRGLIRVPHERTTAEVLDQHFRDPALKAVLASQWGCYGLPPRQSPFTFHALLARHYSRGAHFPVGGSGRIAAVVRDMVEERGGRFLLGREVTEIILERGRATGVRVRAGRDGVDEYFAPVIVSNAGAPITFTRLLPPEAVPFRARLERFVERHPPATNLTLFLGLTRDPRELGARGGNTWIYDGLDHDELHGRRAAWFDGGEPPYELLTFPSLKDPEAVGHTAELISFTDYAPFAAWRDQPWNKRDADYKALKERLADGMLRPVERLFPGFSETVEVRELGTPLTNEFFAGHPGGAAYGLTSVAERFARPSAEWTHPKSPIPNLFMTGADVGAAGVLGAIWGGIFCTGYLPDGMSTQAVLKAVREAPS